MRKAIFWDFDGTLVHPGHLWSRALFTALGPAAGKLGITQEMLRPHLKSGFPWHPDGDPSLSGSRWWPGMLPVFLRAYQAVGVPENTARQAAQRVREVILSPKSYQVRPDAAATLAVCAYKGWRNYILSNNYPELEQVVASLGLGQFFSGIVVSGSVGFIKPDVRIFRQAELLARFPSLIWLVGDSPQTDVEGGKAAGWHTALLSQREQRYSGADVTVARLGDLLHYL